MKLTALFIFPCDWEGVWKIGLNSRSMHRGDI